MATTVTPTAVMKVLLMLLPLHKVALESSGVALKVIAGLHTALLYITNRAEYRSIDSRNLSQRETERKQPTLLQYQQSVIAAT